MYTCIYYVRVCICVGFGLGATALDLVAVGSGLLYRTASLFVVA